MTEISVLCYHGIEAVSAKKDLYTLAPKVFEKHLRFLKENGFKSIPLKHFKKPGRKPIIISFDDGYENAYSKAAPLLEKHDFRGVFFVNPANIKSKPGKFMSWTQLKDIEERGHEVQSHSLNHVHLTKCKKSELIFELKGSKEILERKLGKKIKYLAYPFGSYNKTVEKCALSLGYKGLFTVDPGLNDSRDRLNNIRRFILTRQDSYDRFSDIANLIRILEEN